MPKKSAAKWPWRVRVDTKVWEPHVTASWTGGFQNMASEADAVRFLFLTLTRMAVDAA